MCVCVCVCVYDDLGPDVVALKSLVGVEELLHLLPDMVRDRLHVLVPAANHVPTAVSTPPLTDNMAVSTAH